MYRRRLRNASGLTLIELMVAVGIIGLVAAMGIPSYLAGKPLRELRADALNLASHMKFAKLNAVKRAVNTGLYFNNTGAAVLGVSPNAYCIYEDSGASPNQYDAGDALLTGKTDISLRGDNQFNAVPATNQTVIFRPNGTEVNADTIPAVATLTVTVSTANGKTRSVTVRTISGHIQVQ